MRPKRNKEKFKFIKYQPYNTNRQSKFVSMLMNKNGDYNLKLNNTIYYKREKIESREHHQNIISKRLLFLPRFQLNFRLSLEQKSDRN